jgi:hypothetical protein
MGPVYFFVSVNSNMNFISQITELFKIWGVKVYNMGHGRCTKQNLFLFIVLTTHKRHDIVYLNQDIFPDRSTIRLY